MVTMLMIFLMKKIMQVKEICCLKVWICLQDHLDKTAHVSLHDVIITDIPSRLQAADGYNLRGFGV